MKSLTNIIGIKVFLFQSSWFTAVVTKIRIQTKITKHFEFMKRKRIIYYLRIITIISKWKSKLMKMVMFGGIKYSLKASGNNNYYDTNTLVSVAKMYSQIFRTSKGNLWIKRATCTVMYFCVIAGCYSFEETCPSQSSKYFMVLAD